MGVRGLCLFIPSSVWYFIDVSQWKNEEKERRRKRRGGGNISQCFVFTCSSCQNCFDVIWLKVIWICDCVYFYVVYWFQRQPQGTDVASPNPDIKGCREFWPACDSSRHSMDCQFKCNGGFNIGTLHTFLSLCCIYSGFGQVQA